MTDSGEPTVPTEAAESEEATATEQTPPKSTKADTRRLHRTRALFAPVGRVLAKIPHPPWHSKRGIFVQKCHKEPVRQPGAQPPAIKARPAV